MTYIKNTFQQAWQAIQISRDDLAEATASVVLAGGAIYAMWLAVQQDIVALTLFLPGLALLFGLANYPPLQNRLLSRSFNLRHVLHTVYYWGFGAFGWHCSGFCWRRRPPVKKANCFMWHCWPFWG